MKKFAAVVAVAVLVAFAAPAFAVVNPFMDVPMNHWAYDAIGQLAAHGILSGYPDGTYKGKQPTTRYEMASALARALAVVDMTKASKQDVAMLQRLVVEFHDELEALGVRVDDLDGRVAVIEDRLGGWKLEGRVRIDIKYNGEDERYDRGNKGKARGAVDLSQSRIWIKRYFGDPENPAYFEGQLDDQNTSWSHFFVELPFAFDTKLTVGRFEPDWEVDYYYGGTTGSGELGGSVHLDGVLTDRIVNGIGIQKSFGLGEVKGYIAHSSTPYSRSVNAIPYTWNNATQSHEQVLAAQQMRRTYTAWELTAMAKLQFTEQFGFDLGGQILIGDNSDWDAANAPVASDSAFDNIWTVFGGLRFNFTQDVALRGIFYHQGKNADTFTNGAWVAVNPDSANYWKLIIDVNQNLLKYTGAWLEYGHVDAGFRATNGSALSRSGANSPATDLKYWRAALAQKWNDKWNTYEFYYNYDLDGAGEDWKEWGLGVQYKYNSALAFGLNYTKIDYDGTTADESVINFRTSISF